MNTEPHAAAREVQAIAALHAGLAEVLAQALVSLSPEQVKVALEQAAEIVGTYE